MRDLEVGVVWLFAGRFGSGIGEIRLPVFDLFAWTLLHIVGVRARSYFFAVLSVIRAILVTALQVHRVGVDSASDFGCDIALVGGAVLRLSGGASRRLCKCSVAGRAHRTQDEHGNGSKSDQAIDSHRIASLWHELGGSRRPTTLPC